MEPVGVLLQSARTMDPLGSRKPGTAQYQKCPLGPMNQGTHVIGERAA